jgi:hypothetical protein
MLHVNLVIKTAFILDFTTIDYVSNKKNNSSKYIFTCISAYVFFHNTKMQKTLTTTDVVSSCDYVLSWSRWIVSFEVTELRIYFPIDWRRVIFDNNQRRYLPVQNTQITHYQCIKQHLFVTCYDIV